MNQARSLKPPTGSYHLIVSLPRDLTKRVEVGCTINPRQQKPVERRHLKTRKVGDRKPHRNGFDWVRTAHTKIKTRSGGYSAQMHRPSLTPHPRLLQAGNG